MITHKEFSIGVRSPNDIKKCVVTDLNGIDCDKYGDWAMFVEDDRGKNVMFYENLCEFHLLVAVNEALTADFHKETVK